MERLDGYAPIREYAVVGDGRTVALVASDGAVDWLCLPQLDSPSVFGSLLDARGGGSFVLTPSVPYDAERRYLAGTNVLQTTFSTAEGAVRVTDAMTLPRPGLPPLRELVRRVEGLAGSVPMRWRVEPRFGYAGWTTRLDARGPFPVAAARRDAIGVCTWGAGDPLRDDGGVGADFEIREGETAALALVATHQEPLVFPGRDDVEARLEETADYWRRWSGDRTYDGPWREAVVRSALALKLLVHAPSGAVAAAATTSLPETIGGERNWDYRYSWVRDAGFTLNALQALGCAPEAEAFFSWLLHASQLTHPRLHVLYRLDGGARAEERTLPLAGYLGSRPVRIGNAAVDQFQLDVYGDLLETAYLYVEHGNAIDRDAGRRVADVADYVCRNWHREDAGIWETRGAPAHFTHSKMMCCVALTRASALARRGAIPAKQLQRWERELAAIREFVERRCWSDEKRSYVRTVGTEDLDASLLLGVLMGYDAPDAPRLRATVDAVRRELADGVLVYRYRGQDGLAGEDGAFLACSFWLVDALARLGREDEAAGMMDELVGLANDVGLYAEEIDLGTRAFLGNFPQALVHLALVNAALSVGREHRS